MNYKKLSDLSNDILNNLYKIPNVDLIIGIPRSGLLAANIISLYFNKPITTIEQFIKGNFTLGNGYTRNIISNEIKSILVVDDSCNTGKAMNQVKEILKEYTNKYNFIYCSIYVTEKSKNYVDVYCDIINSPRIFEWNIMYSYLNKGGMYDLDGVLCENPPLDDDGEYYINYIKNAKPKFIPLNTIDTIVTCRLEKYRDITSKWLEDNNVKYKNLIMLPFNTKKERLKWGKHGQYKAEQFKNSNSKIFFESDYKQAKIIKQFNPNKLVFCVDKMIFV